MSYVSFPFYMTYDTKHLGETGENMAEKYLLDHKYTIMERNYRNKIGEIDIIAKKNRVIVFIEVKTRNSIHADYFLPEQSVNFRKQSKLRKLGEMYINQHNYPKDQEWQIDIISIILDKLSKEARINHIENAVYG